MHVLRGVGVCGTHVSLDAVADRLLERINGASGDLSSYL